MRLGTIIMVKLEWRNVGRTHWLAESILGNYEVQRDYVGTNWVTYRNGQAIHIAGYKQGAMDQAQNDYDDRLRKRQRRQR